MAYQPAWCGGDDTFVFFPTLRDLLFMDDDPFASGFGADPGQGLSMHGGAHPSFMEAGHSFAPASMDALSCQGPQLGGAGLHPLLTLHPLWPTLVDTYYACIKVLATIHARAERRMETDARARVRK
jgi:hypothetical protein